MQKDYDSRNKKGILGEKFKKNVIRDNLNYKKLKEQGWEVIVVWACKLEKIQSRDEALKNLVRTLTQFPGSKRRFCKKKQIP